MTRHYLDILADVIRENWDKPALTDYTLLHEGCGNEYTFGELFQRIQGLRRCFDRRNISEGTHIALCGRNSANWIVAYLAIAAHKCVSVTILNSISVEGIKKLVQFSDAKLILADAEICAQLNDSSIACICLDNISSSISTNTISFPAINPDSLAQICFTSGTQGATKGVMLPFRSISSNVGYRLDIFSMYRGTNMLSLLPLAHIYGLVIEVLLPLCAGARTYIVNDPTSLELCDIDEIIRPKIVFMVPMMVDYYIKRSSNAENWKCLDFISLGGAGISTKIEQTLNSHSIKIAVGYGMTECGSRITLALPEEYRSGSVGKIVGGMDISIASNGEILVRGENVMLGYYKDPEATAAKIDKDGWLHTGDRGHLDEDGYLYVEGRLEQDMIVLPSGENISPVKVESVINACEDVEESIVLARNGKLIALVVIKNVSRFPERSDFREQSEQELRNQLLAQINPQLPAYSQLFGIEFLTTPLARTEKKTIKRYLYK